MKLKSYHEHDVVRLKHALLNVKTEEGKLIRLPKGTGGTIMQSYIQESGVPMYLVEFSEHTDSNFSDFVLKEVSHDDLELVWCSVTKSFVSDANQATGT